MILKLVIHNSTFSALCKIALSECHRTSHCERPTLVQVMAWGYLATSHYLSQCWPASNGQMALLGCNELRSFDLNLGILDDLFNAVSTAWDPNALINSLWPSDTSQILVNIGSGYDSLAYYNNFYQETAFKIKNFYQTLSHGCSPWSFLQSQTALVISYSPPYHQFLQSSFCACMLEWVDIQSHS